MEKKTAKKKKCLKKYRKNRISLNLLLSYLLILIVPAMAVVAVYFVAASAFSDIQKERLTNMLAEVRQTFDREVLRAKNVGYYVSSEQRLQEYLSQKKTGSLKNEYFSLYTVARNYPNYNMMNPLIQDIYVLISDSGYIMKIPQVIPQTKLGISTLEDFPFSSYQQFMEYFSSQNPSRDLYVYTSENSDGEKLLFLVSRVAHRIRSEKSAVVVVLDWKQIDEILMTVLAGQDGVAALLDNEGKVLTCVRNAVDFGDVPGSGLSWNEYLAENGLEGKAVVSCEEYSAYDGWKVAVAVPGSVLTGRAGTARFVVAILCALSLLIGLLISLTYWYQRKSIVEQYLLLRDRMGVSDKGFRFWDILKNFLGDVNEMWDTLELQKIRFRDLFLRKLFYGGFGSRQELEKEASQADVDISRIWYYPVYIELENLVKVGFDSSEEELTQFLEDLFADCIKWEYYIYRVSELSYALLVACDGPEDEELKDVFGQMSYSVNSQLKIHSYVGLGPGTGDIEKLPGQFDMAYRLAEIARYRGIHFPVFPSDVPEEELSDRPLAFPVDMELKLLQLLRTGTEEQLEELITQIDEVYFRPGNSRYTYRHTVEALRSSVFRSISMCGREVGTADGLREAARHAQNSEEIFALLRETRQYCVRSTQEMENAAPDMERDRVAAYIEEYYGDPNLNLAMLAEWLNETERKVYSDFKLCFGMTFSAYLEQCRMKHACALLKEGTAVRDTAEMVGYGSDYSFRRAFKRVVGIAPSDFGKLKND